MLVAWAAILVMTIVALGWGAALWHLARRLSGLPAGRPLLGELGLMGLLSLGVGATIVNFAAPVTSLVAVILGLSGVGFAVYFARNDRSLRAVMASWPFSSAMLVVSFVLAAFVGSGDFGYDAGLYHLPVQQWIRSEPIVFGLANLHGRFGFNSIQEPLSSLLWLPHDNFTLVAIGESLYYLFFFAVLVQFLLTPARKRSSFTVLFSLLVPLSFLLFNDYYVFTVTFSDPSVGLIFLVCTLAYLRLFDRASDLGDRNAAFLSLHLLVVFALMLKLSSVPLLLLVAAADWHMLRLRRSSLVDVVRLGSLSAVLAVPTVVRGLVLSGCVGFPAEQTCLRWLPWSAEAKAVALTDAVRGWARAPHTTLAHRVEVLNGGAPWFGDWLDRNLTDVVWILVLPLVLTAVVAVVVVFSASLEHRTPGPTSTERRSIAIPGLIVFQIVSLAFWFYLAPDLRFGIGALHLFTVVLPLLVFWRWQVAERSPTRWVSVFASLGIVLVVWSAVELAGAETSLDTATSDPFTFASLVPPVAEVTPNTSVGIHPVGTDQCWVTDEPCSPSDGEFVLRNRGPFTEIVPARPRPSRAARTGGQETSG